MHATGYSTLPGTIILVGRYKFSRVPRVNNTTTWLRLLLVGRICNNFEKNRALYDKSMKLGTWQVDNKTKKLRVSARPKMPSNGRLLVFPKWRPFSTFSL